MFSRTLQCTIGILLFSCGSFVIGNQSDEPQVVNSESSLEEPVRVPHRREKSTTSTSTSKSSKKSASGGSVKTQGAQAILVNEFTPSFDVVSCSQDEVIVQGAQAFELDIGHYIIVPSSEDASICTSCAPLFRKITGIQEGTIDGKVTFTYSTEFATFREVGPVDVIAEARLDTDIEPLIGCSHSVPPGSRQLEAALPSMDEGHRSLQVSSCAEWHTRDTSGNCVHSNCHVGDQILGACFECDAPGQPGCDNGCGKEGSIFAFDGKFEYGPFEYDFGEACCIHDYCYSSQDAYSRKECDSIFLKNMKSECRGASIGVSVKTALFLPLPFAFTINYLDCVTFANIFYGLVRVGGGGTYRNSGIKQREYEISPACVEQCPSTRESGGRGTYRFAIDMLRNGGVFPVSYNFYTIPDELTIEHEGKVLFSTNGLVSGTNSFDLSFSGSSSRIDIVITAPNTGTKWDMDIGCPRSSNRRLGASESDIQE